MNFRPVSIAFETAKIANIGGAIENKHLVSQNFPLAIERDSAQAGSTIGDCILSYKSDFILHNSTLHVPFYDDFNLTKFYKTAACVSEGSPHPDANSGVVTIIKCGASSLLTFNIDSWALISTNFLLSVGLLDNYGANPYGG